MKKAIIGVVSFVLMAALIVGAIAYTGRNTVIYVNQSGTEVERPSEQELVDFLATDDTNLIPYSEDYFNCVDFSWALIRSMQRHDWPLAVMATLEFYDNPLPHVMVRVLTSDSGWVFVEPQTDGLWTPKVGEYYWVLGIVKQVSVFSLEQKVIEP